MFYECKHCGKAIKSSFPIYTCAQCKEIDEQLYNQITDYLVLHPLSNAIEISQALGIRRTLILKYVDERKLTIVSEKR